MTASLRKSSTAGGEEHGSYSEFERVRLRLAEGRARDPPLGEHPCSESPCLSPCFSAPDPLSCSRFGKRAALVSTLGGTRTARAPRRLATVALTLILGARNTASRLRARHLAREVGGGNHGGQTPSPQPPPGADLCPPRVGEGTRLPRRPGPLQFGRTAASLDSEAGRPFKFSMNRETHRVRSDN
jgi:hypothetical protein